MPYPNTKLVHIYGFAVNNGETPEIKSPAKLFKLHFYGSTEHDDEDKLHYVGIEIGRELNPFKRLCAKQHGSFQMSQVTAPANIIKQMKKLYPRKDLKCNSFLSDIYTSHYYAGTIMVGYFFSCEGNYTLQQESADDDDNWVDPRDRPISEIVEGDTEDVEDIVNVSHTLENGFGEYFLGKQLSSDFECFEFSHEEDPGHKFYNMCREIHNLDDHTEFNLSFKEGFVSSNKLIAFVPSMCYCCT